VPGAGECGKNLEVVQTFGTGGDKLSVVQAQQQAQTSLAENTGGAGFRRPKPRALPGPPGHPPGLPSEEWGHRR